MALTAAQKKAAQALIDKANAQKAKLEAQLAAAEKAKADADAAKAAEAARIKAENDANIAFANEASQAATNAAAQAKQIQGNKGFATIGGFLYSDDMPFNGTINGVTYYNGSPQKTGASSGATPATSITETPERTLAKDTFINTLKLTMGATEASKSYVSKLYELVSGYYKSGSTEDEALNLAIRDAYENNAIPEFTKRFQGIFDLQKKLQEGQAIVVPTVAEYVAAEAKMGEVLTNAGLGELATQDFLGGVIGKGKSVLEVGNLIGDVFTAIDTAPTALKTTLQTFFPGVDRVAIAKAILTGPEGAAALAQKVKGATTLSAAASQGLTVDLATATDIANMGYGYQESLTGFGKVKAGLADFEKLKEMRVGTDVKTTDAQTILQKSIFGQDIAAQEEMRKLAEEEQNRFKATAGLLGSKSLASQQRAAGLI